MNPFLNHQMAQARQADLLREGEEYRRAGLTPRRRILARVTTRIARFTARPRPSGAPAVPRTQVVTPTASRRP